MRAYECGIFVEVKKYGKKYTSEQRRAYQEQGCCLTVGEPDLVTHHITPIKMGGSNDWHNLVPMDKDEHRALHREYLDPQVNMFNVGDRGYMYVPTVYEFNTPAFRAYERSWAELMCNNIIEKTIKRWNER